MVLNFSSKRACSQFQAGLDGGLIQVAHLKNQTITAIEERRNLSWQQNLSIFQAVAAAALKVGRWHRRQRNKSSRD